MTAPTQLDIFADLERRGAFKAATSRQPWNRRARQRVLSIEPTFECWERGPFFTVPCPSLPRIGDGFDDE